MFFTLPLQYNTISDNDSFLMSVKMEKYYKLLHIGYITNQYYKKMKDIGSYIIIINSNYDSGPNAIYAISKAHIMQDGNINILSNSPDLNGNTLELEWNKGEYPLLKYRRSHSDYQNVNDNTLMFLVKVITSF